MTRRVEAPVGAPQDESFSLRRWSRRKLAAAREAAPEAAPPPAMAPPAVAAPTAGASIAAVGEPVVPQQTAPPLPPVESLTFDSDFRAFMQPHVEETLKRQALRKLLHDPRFNVMDGLDVYIDDYSLPSPLEPEVARSLMQARYVFNPPPTRVNADGYVEDVPPQEEGDEGEEADAEQSPAIAAHVADTDASAAIRNDGGTSVSPAAIPGVEGALQPDDVPVAAGGRREEPVP